MSDTSPRANRVFPARRAKALKRFLASLLLVTILPMCAAILLAVNSLTLIEREIENSSRISFENAASEVSRAFSNANVVCYRLSINGDLTDYVNSNERDYYTEYRIRYYLGSSVAGDFLVKRAYLYFPDIDYVISNEYAAEGEYYFKTNYGSESDAVREFLATPQKNGFAALPTGENARTTGRNVAIRSIQGANRQCVVVVEINSDTLINSLNTILWNDSDRVYVRSASGLVLSTLADEQNERITLLLDGKARPAQIEFDDGSIRKLLYGNAPQYGLESVYVIDSESAADPLRYAKTYALFCLFACLVITVILCLLLSKKNYQPLERLMRIIPSSGAQSEYEAIEEAFQGYMSHNLALSQTVSLNEQRLRRLYLQNLLAGNIPDIESVPDSMHLYGVQFSEDWFAVAVIQLRATSDMSNNGEDYPIMHSLSQTFEREYPDLAFYALPIGDQNVFLFNANERDSHLLNAGFLANALASTGKAEEYDAFISPVANGVGMLSDCYSQAQQAGARMSQEESSESEATPEAGIVQKCTALIKCRYADGTLSVATLADTLSLNASYLSRYFKQQTGVGLLEYLHRYRVLAAKEAIAASPELSLSELAAQTGFYNSAALIRVFKKIEGITPGQYSERMRNM